MDRSTTGEGRITLALLREGSPMFICAKFYHKFMLRVVFTGR